MTAIPEINPADLIAILPARGGSKRLPRKNIAPLAGRPLISYPIRAALESGVFGRVIVSTEDPEITEIAAANGAQTFRRSEQFATDTAHELDACAELLDAVERESGRAPYAFCVIYPAAVFIEPEDFKKSFALLDGDPPADTVMCVSGFNYHPYKALTRDEQGYLRMMFPVECKQRSQTYPQVAASNGTIYWLRTEAFRKNRDKGYYMDRLVPYEIPFERAVDIDYPEDLKRTEFLMRFRAGLH